MKALVTEFVPFIIMMWREQLHPGCPIEEVRQKYEKHLRMLVFSPTDTKSLYQQTRDWLGSKEPSELCALMVEYFGIKV